MTSNGEQPCDGKSMSKDIFSPMAGEVLGQSSHDAVEDSLSEPITIDKEPENSQTCTREDSEVMSSDGVKTVAKLDFIKGGPLPYLDLSVTPTGTFLCLAFKHDLDKRLSQ